MKTIVVGYDQTAPADVALERAAELARAFGAALAVVSVAPVVAGAAAVRAGPIDPADSPARHEDELRHARDLLAPRGVTAEYELGLGDPAEALVEIAERRGADLLVVGTREPSLLARLLGLSVSGGVQRRAHCDVLIVHERHD